MHTTTHPHRTRRAALRRSGLALGASLLMATAACSGSAEGTSASTAGPIVVGQTSVLEDTDPINSPWALRAAGVAESVYTVDPDGALSSRFVSGITQDGPLDWTLTVVDGVEFADGTPADAAAIAWSLDTIQQDNELANASAGVISFTADGDQVKVRTERPTTVLESVLAEWTNVVYREGEDGQPVFTGPYEVTDLDPGVSVSLTPNPNYPDSDRRSDVTMEAYPDVDAMRLALQSGSLDMAFTVTPEVAEQLEGSAGISVETIDAGYQYMGFLNTVTGPAADPAVRQALDLGLDREDYVTALRGGQPANGLFAHYYSFAGGIEPDLDVAEAGRVLDAAGWVPGADGVRVKDGQRLTLSLVTYASRPDLSTIMQVMVSQLADLGIDSSTSVVDDIRAQLTGGDFDLALWAQHTAPTGEPAYFLNQFFRTGAGNNFSGYTSATTDALLDQLGAESPGPERDATAVAVQEQLHTDRPVLFLVDPQWHVAVDERLAGYRAWSGDYYVVNPELGVS